MSQLNEWAQKGVISQLQFDDTGQHQGAWRVNASMMMDGLDLNAVNTTTSKAAAKKVAVTSLVLQKEQHEREIELQKANAEKEEAERREKEIKLQKANIEKEEAELY